MEDDGISGVVHPKFKHVFIPAEIENEMEERVFEGKESDFSQSVRRYFAERQLSLREKGELEKTLKEKSADDMSSEQVEIALNTTGQSYEIVPLTLPTKENGFLAINAYIDGVGRVKQLQTNARASRICSVDIRGDCFVSRTFDDEETFRRVDLTLSDVNDLMKSPPSAAGRWSPSSTNLENLKQMMGQQQQSAASLTNTAEAGDDVVVGKRVCGNCRAETTAEGGSLLRCQRCKKESYCSVECQKKDWRFHRRICKG